MIIILLTQNNIFCLKEQEQEKNTKPGKTLIVGLYKKREAEAEEKKKQKQMIINLKRI